MNDAPAFELLGDFSSTDAEKILERLTVENIVFSLESNDEAIRTMPAFQAGLGGLFGSGVFVRIFVAQEHAERANEISTEILGLIV